MVPIEEQLRRIPADISIGMQLDHVTFGAPYYHFPVGAMCHAAADEIVKLAAENEGLKTLLKRYGRHTTSCMKLDYLDERNYGCTCGFEKALAAAEFERAALAEKPAERGT